MTVNWIIGKGGGREKILPTIIMRWTSLMATMAYMHMDFVLRPEAKTGRFASGIFIREKASQLLIPMFRSYGACRSRPQRMCCYRQVETRQLFYGMLALGRP